MVIRLKLENTKIVKNKGFTRQVYRCAEMLDGAMIREKDGNKYLSLPWNIIHITNFKNVSFLFFILEFSISHTVCYSFRICWLIGSESFFSFFFV